MIFIYVPISNICIVEILEDKFPNNNALKCICDGNFTLTYIKSELRKSWVKAFEESQRVPVISCRWCELDCEKDSSTGNFPCIDCEFQICGACFESFADGTDHKCPIILTDGDIMIKCASCSLIGIVDATHCMRIHCIGCGECTCACCMQLVDQTPTSYNHFCRSFAIDPVCTKEKCKHCYCWPSLKTAKTATTTFLHQYPHLDYRS